MFVSFPSGAVVLFPHSRDFSPADKRKYVDYWNFYLVVVPHRVSYLSLISSSVEFLLLRNLIRVELPSRVSSTMDLFSVHQQILGGGSVASPTEQFVPSPSDRDVPSVARSECLVDVLLFGGCSPQNFILLPDKIHCRVLLWKILSISLHVPENCWKIPGSW
jgi:hypothetical protein